MTVHQQAYYYISSSNDPFYNIALEDYLYTQMRDVGCIYFFWVNAPSVFMGRYQCAEAESDVQYLAEQSIPILRRASGGGTVYHDAGNLNYTCIQNDLAGRGFDLRAFPLPVVEAMQGQGVDLEVSPRGDLRLEGYKVGGSAEATRSGRMLYHMSLLFDADLEQLERVLQVGHEVQVRSRVPSVRSRVRNLKTVLPSVATIEDFRDLILSVIRQRYDEVLPLELSQEAEAYISAIRAERYANPEWIHSSVGRMTKKQG
ncbi:MAG: biotin/lipoate A/B protein ligase family protein [Porphyromonadaceae bacterium]|nr:biotin/lipoate A/B protein ligase family protein [Porphyromonadaceae bacterium]